MPHITAAMQRSVRRGVSDIVFDSLLRRDSPLAGEANSVKNTFSSWDNCMAKAYCKWPIIIGIVVVSLILFSILWCIIRCACCGMSCCCTCFSFLKCCDCCGGCCDGKKDKPMKHLDDDYPPHQGYQAPPPMMGGGLGAKPAPPQFAQFDVGPTGLAVAKQPTLSEDALPPMPSWDSAVKKHVLSEEEKNAVELGELDPATGQKVPLMAGASGPGISSPPSPANDMGASPFGQRPGQGVGGNGYMADPYSQNQNGSYRGAPSPGPGRGMGGTGGPGRSYGPTSPVGQGRGYGPPSSQDPYGQNYGQNNGFGNDMAGQGRGYGPQSPQDPYGSNAAFGAAAVGGYGRSQPQRQNSNDAYGSSRPFPPQPQRQYSSDSARPLNPGRQYSDRPYPADNSQPPRGPSRGPGGPGRLASPPLNNNSGFDFTGSQHEPEQPYSSRPSPPPQQMPYGPSQRSNPPGGYYAGSTAPPSYASRSPPPQEQEPSYPGYRPYQASPNQGRGGAPQALTPGGGRGGREPQNWDPVQR